MLDSAVKDIKEFSSNVIGIVGDISNHDDVKKVVAETIQRFGKIDILVNNAAIQQPIGLFKDIDIKDWVDSFNINLFGTALFCKEILPYFVKQKKGKIINFSGGGATFARPNFSSYGVAKTAVVRFTETIAEELKAFNIDVNAISPGIVDTRMFKEYSEFKKNTQKESQSVEQKLNFIDPKIPAKLVVFFSYK